MMNADALFLRDAVENAVGNAAEDELSSDELRGVAGGWTSQGPPADCDP